MEGIIWTPRFHRRYDFGVLLDRNFAESMVQSQISKERQKRMNELANNDLKSMGIGWLNPYSFHGSSCFVDQVYIGRNGVWLSTNHREIELLLRGEESPKPVQYNSHNVDTSHEAYVLMALFDKWVYFSERLREE